MDHCKKSDSTCTCLERCKSREEQRVKEEDLPKIIQVMKKLPNSSPLYKALLRTVAHKKGDWFIESIEHNFCFWAYLKDNPDRKHTLQEVGNLIGMSISAVANIERKALAKLKESLDPEDFR